MTTAPSVPAVVDRLDALVAAGRTFGTVYAAPRYDQSPRGAASHHYPTMTAEELAALPVDRLAAPDSHLHLWTTHSFYARALTLLTAWGFAYRSLFVWVKPQLGTGHYWRSSSEFLLLGVRGRPPFRDRSVPNWDCAPRGRHSEKPDVVRKLVELVSPGPYLEPFGRKAVAGWTVFGNEVTGAEGNPVTHAVRPERDADRGRRPEVLE